MQSKGACTEESYGYKGRAGTCQIDSCIIGLAGSAVTGDKDVTADTNALAEAVAMGPALKIPAHVLREAERCPKLRE